MPAPRPPAREPASAPARPDEATDGAAPRDRAAGQPAAIEDVLPALYARLRGRLGGVLYRFHIPTDEAEDLVQTTLLFAVAKWNGIRDPEAWLIGTLHKRCILYWRTRRSHLEYTRPMEQLDRQRGGEPDQTRRERFADLGKVWHRLPPTHRKLLLLRFQEGMSPREAAQAVGIAHSSVRKTTNRAFKRLRAALGTAPPRGTPCVPRAPRLPAAALRIGKTIRREAAGAGVTAEWSAAVEAFLAASTVKATTRNQYRYHLIAVGAALEWRALAELTESDLLAFRAALLIDGRAAATHACVLLVMRSFLVWAGAEGWLAIDRDVIRGALRGWGSTSKGPPPRPGRRHSPHASGRRPGLVD
jgi:RNA polymerase sigma-70 factor, ECF subfamily